MITIDDFKKVELRIGTIIKAEEFPEANIPAYKLEIDFGGFGIRKSSAQIMAHYTADELMNKQVIAVVNFAPKKIAPFVSEVLILGANGKDDGIILLALDKPMPNGSKIS
ncbi:MAG: tRNA-binding protein [Candidatus Marinimicrobia bacterium]|nr:tRNA-binding protein [Candidatus Neomarinimicrobiota bacterium]MCH7762259.1 tRNA-binding protein [Candidatus Neomarinimicrobiota bacterium]